MREDVLVGSSASNGLAERGVQTVERRILVLKDALEERWGSKTSGDRNAVACLVELASAFVNRCEVGYDVRVLYETARGNQRSRLD